MRYALYGVMIGADGAVNEDDTAQRRALLRRERMPLAPVAEWMVLTLIAGSSAGLLRRPSDVDLLGTDAPVTLARTPYRRPPRPVRGTASRCCSSARVEAVRASSTRPALSAVGRRLRVREPRNHLALRTCQRYVFIAGGIGITPILAMVRYLGEEVPWTLHYGGRSRRSTAFVDELIAIGGERVVVVPEDVDGLLDLDEIFARADVSTAVYCCGPPALLDAVQRSQDRLAPGSALYVERFTTGGAGLGPGAAPRETDKSC